MATATEDFICEAYIRTDKYSDGDTSSREYKLCCEEYSYCSFYNQGWFHFLCYLLGVLLLVALGVIIYKYCQKRRGIGGIDEDASEPTTPEIIDP
ncbi:unnamed protein product [Caenorhabditis nigoni]